MKTDLKGSSLAVQQVKVKAIVTPVARVTAVAKVQSLAQVFPHVMGMARTLN